MRGINIKSMVTRETVISNLKMFAGDMKKSGFHLNKMVLYGSYSIK